MLQELKDTVQQVKAQVWKAYLHFLNLFEAFGYLLSCKIKHCPVLYFGTKVKSNSNDVSFTRSDCS